jgi:hypothetical protein
LEVEVVSDYGRWVESRGLPIKIRGKRPHEDDTGGLQEAERGSEKSETEARRASLNTTSLTENTDPWCWTDNMLD